MPKNWKSMLLYKDDKIINGIKLLNKTGLLIIIIVNKSNQLIGTVTDGDIRKGLAKNIILDDKLELIMNKNPKYIFENTDPLIIKKIISQEYHRAYPIINQKKVVVGCHFLDDFFAEEEKPPFLIMAGGFGKRLGKLTEDCPKPMLKVNNKPILEHIIIKAREEGFKNIYISTHYKSDVIENYFSKKNNLNVNISYFKEEKPLGTGGGFRFMKKFNGPIVVTNGDIISKIGYQKLLDFHNSNNGFATMAIIKHKIENPFGVVKYEGIQLTEFQEKPYWTTYVNAGIYVLNNKASKLIKKNEFISMPHLFNKIKNKNESVLIFHMHENWIDIGTPAELNKIKKDLEKFQ